LNRSNVVAAGALLATLAAPACKSDSCTSAPPAIFLELFVDDEAETPKIRSLEVTLSFGEHRFRHRYAANDALLDGRTTIFAELDPAPAAATEIEVDVRAFESDDASGRAVLEANEHAPLEPTACNALSLHLSARVVDDAGPPTGADASAADDASAIADAAGSSDGGGSEDAAVGAAADAEVEPDAGAPSDADAPTDAIASPDASPPGDATAPDAAAPDAAAADATARDAAAPDAAPIGQIHRRILVDNTPNASALASYPVRVVFNSAAPIAQGKMRPDGADLRFTDADGVSSLSYWIESGIGTGVTNVWVNVPSIARTSSKTIHMSYHDPAATPASNGHATFLFYADFDGSTLGDDGSQEGLTPLSGSWSVVLGGSRGQGYEEAGTPSRQSAMAAGSWSDVAVSVKIRLPMTVSSGVNGLYMRVTDENNLYFFGPFQQNGMTFGKYSGGVYTAISEIVTAVDRQMWHDITLAASGTTFRGYLDGVLSVTGTDGSFASGGIGLRSWGTQVRYDELRVRPYSFPEPVTAVGPEY
jgi:uncharacterized protein DUF2341/3-keto-disaccharide hydrolase